MLRQRGFAATRRSGGSTVAAAVVLAFATSSSRAHAQNGDSFFFSDEAALTSGAVTAMPGEPGAIWYNPAGLAALNHNRVNVNASVLGVRIREIPEALRVRWGDAEGSIDLGGADLISSPTAVSASFALLDNLTIGGGAFTTARDIRTGNGTDHAEGSDGRTIDQRLDLVEDVKKLRAGGSFGFDAGHGLRVGAGMFAVLTTVEVAADYTIALTSPDASRTLVSVSDRVSRTTWGLQASGGIQWDVSPTATLGLTIRGPELMFESSINDSAVTIVSTPSGSTVDFVDDGSAEDEVGWIDPAHVVFGVMLTPVEALRLTADIDLALGIDNQPDGPARRPVMNARGGFIFRVIEELELGAGAFVDLPTVRSLGPDLGSYRVTYVGGTLGGTLRTPLRVGDDPRPDRLVLTTTLAIRYAAGLGTGRLTRLEEDQLSSPRSEIVVHDIMPYTGSAILF